MLVWNSCGMSVTTEHVWKGSLIIFQMVFWPQKNVWLSVCFKWFRPHKREHSGFPWLVKMMTIWRGWLLYNSLFSLYWRSFVIFIFPPFRLVVDLLTWCMTRKILKTCQTFNLTSDLFKCSCSNRDFLKETFTADWDEKSMMTTLHMWWYWECVWR